MSARIDLTGVIYGDLLVLEFDKQVHTHAQWKCLCMVCNSLVYKTASNLKSSKRNSCRSCAQKRTNYKQDYEIVEKYKSGEKISHIAKDFGINRDTVCNVIKRDSSLAAKNAKG